MILVCGEALIDFLPDLQRTDTSLAFSGFPGGSPFNVAIALARQNRETAYFSHISQDMFGKVIKNCLLKEKIDLSFMREKPEPTTLAFVNLDQEGVADYVFLGENAADRMITITDIPADFPKTVSTLAFGSFSLAVEPCGSTYETLIEKEHGRRLIAIDPNIRSRLIPDMEHHRKRLEHLISLSDLVKASREDLCELYAGEEPEIIARRWQDSASARKLIVITDGPHGASALLDGQWLSWPGMSVEVVDTIGAGDCFQASLLASLEQQKLLSVDTFPQMNLDHLDKAIRHAISASALLCTRKGADMPTEKEISGFTEQRTIY